MSLLFGRCGLGWTFRCASVRMNLSVSFIPTIAPRRVTVKPSMRELQEGRHNGLLGMHSIKGVRPAYGSGGQCCSRRRMRGTYTLVASNLYFGLELVSDANPRITVRSLSQRRHPAAVGFRCRKNMLRNGSVSRHISWTLSRGCKPCRLRSLRRIK
ncbi:hypothetical protein BAUCODRAFT_423005 [Baudoinia panamericana UAMH 10762]|uniref:Uncharacterized protein n=1 Tax=Baudoinia panamericana (strain UAMH 10762) TaxID=717646 RepID=M2MNV1_BAUPA|nr:uncharacterized protein BAUCODRAFT_423005 [Baudoinia panamericana UAMH 10762]EMC98371.1 hypothetical protein BAUCODRAFT_423005 [Baudoinia panamericana UAMH 10762]